MSPFKIYHFPVVSSWNANCEHKLMSEQVNLLAQKYLHDFHLMLNIVDMANPHQIWGDMNTIQKIQSLQGSSLPSSI